MIRGLATRWMHVAYAVLTCANSSDGQTASFDPLGVLPGMVESSGIGISWDGSVIVGCSGTNDKRAYRWSPSTGMVELPALPGQMTPHCALDVSDDGTVVIGISGTFGVQWENGQVTSLGALPGSKFEYSYARAVSGDGVCIVGHASSTVGTEGFIRTESTGMAGLGNLPGEVFPTFAEDVSTDGSVIVGAGGSPQGFQAFRIRDGYVEGLGDLPGGTFESVANAVSRDGRVVVGQGNVDAAAGKYMPFHWTEAHGMVPIGHPPGHSHSDAFAVSNDGWVIVGWCAGQAAVFGTIWDPLRGNRVLDDVLMAHGVDLNGWSVAVCPDISGNGTVITGRAVSPQGAVQAFRAVVPRFCYADCEYQSSPPGQPSLDLFDFLCYINRFNSQDLYSDCDQDGNHDLNDFLCFVNHFNAACP